MSQVTHDDIAKIMNEIDELQDSLKEAETPTPSAESVPEEEVEEDIMKEFQAAGPGASSEASMEDTLSDLKEEASPNGPNLLDQVIEENFAEAEETSVTKTHPVTEGDAHNEGTLSMTLQGNMTLNLSYEFEGQAVTLSFADGALRVSLADGTEFRVPVARAAAVAGAAKPRLKRVV